MRNSYDAVWDRVRQYAVLAGICAKFSHNPGIQQHIFSTGTERLAQPSLFDPVWDIRADVV